MCKVIATVALLAWAEWWNSGKRKYEDGCWIINGICAYSTTIEEEHFSIYGCCDIIIFCRNNSVNSNHVYPNPEPGISVEITHSGQKARLVRVNYTCLLPFKTIFQRKLLPLWLDCLRGGRVSLYSFPCFVWQDLCVFVLIFKHNFFLVGKTSLVNTILGREGNSIQLSPEGEVNSDRYIYRDANPEVYI